MPESSTLQTFTIKTINTTNELCRQLDFPDILPSYREPMQFMGDQMGVEHLFSQSGSTLGATNLDGERSTCRLTTSKACTMQSWTTTSGRPPSGSGHRLGSRWDSLPDARAIGRNTMALTSSKGNSQYTWVKYPFNIQNYTLLLMCCCDWYCCCYLTVFSFSFFIFQSCFLSACSPASTPSKSRLVEASGSLTSYSNHAVKPGLMADSVCVSLVTRTAYWG